MTEHKPERVSTHRAYDGRLLKVDVDTLRAPNGNQLELEIIRHPGASAVVPLLSDSDAPDPTVLLIRQFRHAAGGFIWEIPAGVLEPGETPERCARRELEEETGATAERIEHLATVLRRPASPTSGSTSSWPTGSGSGNRIGSTMSSWK